MTVDQAQATYAAEDLWKAKEHRAQTRFGDWNEVWPFYYTLAERCRDANIADVKPPTVKPRRGALEAHYDPTTATIYLPPYSKGGTWALNTGTAIHEFAHHLTPSEGHRPAFRAAMLSCLSALGWDWELLAKCYAEVGLTTSDKGDGITDKVSKLLTHADKAGTDEERRTYIEKAEELASEHSVNLALIRKKEADANGVRSKPITGEMFPLTGLPNVTYRNLAVELGASIARAHGVKCVIRGRSQWMVFYGFPEDVNLTELMLKRVTPMMFEESDRYLHSPEHRYSGVASVSARITFCQYFAMEVGSRLKEAVKQTEMRAIERGSLSTELALREKALEVDDYAAYEFRRQGVRGSWAGSQTRNWSGTAADAGRTAAQNANLYGRERLE